MKRAYLTQFNNPSDSVELRDEAAPAAPKASQVLVKIMAASINPAELLLIQGLYASKPPLPAALGIEGAGEVLSVGDNVSDLAAGDRVMCLPRANWVEQDLFDRNELIKLPGDIDFQQAAMLKVNPATAQMMLSDYETLNAGDWVIQNAANSGVGRNLIQLASANGIKTACVVRRADLKDDLMAQGATAVFIDGPDLAEQVRERLDGRLPLAIDAVGGTATLRLAACLDEDGTVVNYGLLSGEPCQIAAEQAIFKSITLRGYWLAKRLRAMDPTAVQALYRGLAQKVASGDLVVPVEKAYPMAQIGAALDHAMRAGRGGKIHLLPNG